jgi:hypothetical protein
MPITGSGIYGLRNDKSYLRRLERIIWREMDIDQKYPTRERAVSRSHYRSLPMEHIFPSRSC